jgi:hypothetical protein
VSIPSGSLSLPRTIPSSARTELENLISLSTDCFLSASRITSAYSTTRGTIPFWHPLARVRCALYRLGFVVSLIMISLVMAGIASSYSMTPSAAETKWDVR